MLKVTVTTNSCGFSKIPFH